jgi:hypothetical protein
MRRQKSNGCGGRRYAERKYDRGVICPIGAGTDVVLPADIMIFLYLLKTFMK